MKTVHTDIDNAPILNLYPDSIGDTLSDSVAFLEQLTVKDAFGSVYILPSVFNSDLDRGFSIIDYTLNRELAKSSDLEAIHALGIDLKLDFVLNHASVLSPQFQDIIKNGTSSRYCDFFINWNKFWEGNGTMTEAGIIRPHPDLIREMFFRKPGLPVLMIRYPDSSYVPYWNTFYQEVLYPPLFEEDVMHATGVQYSTAHRIVIHVNEALGAGVKPSDLKLDGFETYRKTIIALIETHQKYRGQMDLNIASPLVWEFYENTLDTLAEYGAKIVRLDAFAYAPKAVGKRNFTNEPETWDLLDRLRSLADIRGLSLLPEIHASYDEQAYKSIADKGYLCYDFFFPGLLLDAIENRDGIILRNWAQEIYDNKYLMVNMLGCHDGIPVLDLKGILPDSRIDSLIETIVSRGGLIKDLHGQKNTYYQVNCTYFSALGEKERNLIFSRAVQMFMPGKPQIWYLDLFAKKNDMEAVRRAGSSGHKEINRSNISTQTVMDELPSNVVQQQLALIRFRRNCQAFGFDAKLEMPEAEDYQIHFVWSRNNYKAELDADLRTMAFSIVAYDPKGQEVFSFQQT